jgi:hypothetical protein
VVLKALSYSKAEAKLWETHSRTVRACESATWTCLRRLGFDLPDSGVGLSPQLVSPAGWRPGYGQAVEAGGDAGSGS